MLIPEQSARERISEAIANKINSVAAKCISRRSQEPSITAKIAMAIEEDLTGSEISGYRLEAIVHDLPDRAPRSLEHETGVDLYIGVKVVTLANPSGAYKGLIVQAKKDRKSDRLLPGQCRKMIDRSTEGSFVWIYNGGETQVISARTVLEAGPSHFRDIPVDTLSEHFEKFFECTQGDVRLSNAEIFEDNSLLDQFLLEINPQEASLTIELDQINIPKIK